MGENPVCEKCLNEYDPALMHIERTLVLPKGDLNQWLCDKCGNWVDIT